MEDPVDSAHGQALVVDGEVTLFGFPSSQAVVTILPRPRSWRITGALRTMAIFLAIAPLVALVPPHAPWPIGALAVGVILARRRLSETFTLQALQGVCPKCATTLSVKPSRLLVPHPMPCEGCHHVSSLRLPDRVIEHAG